MGRIIEMTEQVLDDNLAEVRATYHSLMNTGSSGAGLYEDGLFLGALALMEASRTTDLPPEVEEPLLACIELALKTFTEGDDGKRISQGVAEWVRARSGFKGLTDEERFELADKWWRESDEGKAWAAKAAALPAF